MVLIERNFRWQKRINFLLVIIFLFMGMIFLRLFQKSVLEHSQYLALAETQHKVQEEIPALRGKIFAQDRMSEEYYPLATSVRKYSISAIPKNIKNPRAVASQLAPILEINEEEIYNEINNHKLYIPPLKKHLEEKKAKEVSELNLAGVLILPEEIRYYPEEKLASQVLGFVDTEGKGRYGIEGYYDSELKGQKGWAIAQKDASGQIISLDQNQAAQNGSDLILTIDHNVQYFVEQKLVEAKEKYAADSGSIIVMNPKNGAILAMASDPSFDPNKFNELSPDQHYLFMNPAVNLVYEPGSIFKPVCLGAALDNHKIEPDTKGYFTNMTVVQGYEIHTAQDKSFGEETMTQCLENSDNVCLVWVADQIGNEIFYDYIKKFGFGEKTGLDFDNEASGSLLEIKKWRDIHRATMSFGQGISVTPLQLVTAFSAIANGGKLVKPYLVDKIIKSSGEEISSQAKTRGEVISSETASKLTGMLVSVVERGHGKKAKVSGYSIAGKTGTAQIPNPEGGYFEDRHIGSFGGFFPADDPQFTLTVKLDNPKNVEWAESSAAPVFGDIAAWLLNYYEIPPNV